jgi:hypothetical protein
MMNAKRDLERLKAKLGSTEALSWEAKRILQLYPQGLSDWQRGDHKMPWRVNYREALETYGPKFARSEGLSRRTVYLLMFMVQFRGGKDSAKASRSLAEFWLLARRVAPKPVDELVLKDENDEEGKRFIKSMDEELARIFKEGERGETIEGGARIARRDSRRSIKTAMKHLQTCAARIKLRGRPRVRKPLRLENEPLEEKFG